MVEDREIVELFLNRDEGAIRQTAEKYGRRLRGLAYGIVRDMQTAEECEEDTYLKAWESIPPQEPRGYLFAFLARIARNLSLNICRDRRRLKRSAFLCELSAEMEQCIPAPNDCECVLERIVLRDAINGFLATLTTEKRNVFLRRYWYLDPVADIAERYLLSECKVKTMLFRTRNQFRAYLEKEGVLL